MPLTHPVAASAPGQPVTLSNGLVSVEVDETLGTFSLNGRPGYGQLVDGGDLGDSYNYSPPSRTPSSRRRPRWRFGCSSPDRCGPGW